MRRAFVTLAALLTGACTMLTAPAPLFAPTDQDQHFTLAEGLWAAREADCKVNPARSRPGRESCLNWMRLSRTPDGAWLISGVGEDADEPPMRAVVVPAAPRGEGPHAALYVAETTSGSAQEINYVAVAARDIGDDGVVRRVALVGVECRVVSDEWGPIEGIEVRREDGKVVGCTASSQAAVREAARRAAISGFEMMVGTDYLYVRK